MWQRSRVWPKRLQESWETTLPDLGEGRKSLRDLYFILFQHFVCDAGLSTIQFGNSTTLLLEQVLVI
jgi:hypothetical protein